MLKRERSKKYPTETITDTDNANDIVLLANIPPQAEYLQHILDQATEGIGLHVNTNKKEYICF